jgi:hypothetical protein
MEGVDSADYEAADDHVDLTAAALVTCEKPCEAGKMCQLVENTVRMCKTCQINEYGDGQDCQACGPGKQPTMDQTICEPCPAGKISVFGVCVDCDLGQESNDDRSRCNPCTAGEVRSRNMTTCELCAHGKRAEGHVVCSACPPGEQPVDDQSGCSACPDGQASIAGHCSPCQPGFQPTEAKDSCASCALTPGTFSSSGEECQPCPDGQQPSRDFKTCVCASNTYNQHLHGPIECNGIPSFVSPLPEFRCVQCPDCMDCEVGGEPKLKKGWAFYGSGQAFQCPGTQKTRSEACPGSEVKNLSDATTSWVLIDGKYADDTLNQQCGVGYAGPLCGNCDKSDERAKFHHLAVSKPCVACNEGRVDISMLLGLIFAGMIVRFYAESCFVAQWRAFVSFDLAPSDTNRIVGARLEA